MTDIDMESPERNQSQGRRQKSRRLRGRAVGPRIDLKPSRHGYPQGDAPFCRLSLLPRLCWPFWKGYSFCSAPIPGGHEENGMEIEPILCSIPDAAGALGLSRSKTYELIGEGRLATVCIGRRRLVVIDSV